MDLSAALAPVPVGTDPMESLLSVLDLIPAAQVDPATAGAAGQPIINSLGDTDEVFYGRSQPMPHGRVYGGQVVAQALVAAGRTVPGSAASSEAGAESPRFVHSLHGYFLRPGDANEPIQFAVQRLHDGGSFSTRRVHAIQYGKAILSMIFSFQEPSDGFEHADEMPTGVRDPESLPSVAEVLAPLPDSGEKMWQLRRPMDLRHVEGPVLLQAGDPSSEQNVWLRTPGALPNDPLIQAAALAYLSDAALLEVVLRRHQLVWTDPRLRVASLDHSMWFHRPPVADEWVLFTEHTPSATSGRGLAMGTMFTQDGTMIASVAQEGMVRVKRS